MNRHAPNLPRRRQLLAPLCAMFCTAALAPAQTAAPTPAAAQPATGQAVPVEVKPATSQPDDEVLQLSPFQVVADNNGYYQANTMSGTRLNSKIEDLGQSITVMTKEQMLDFAMLDINDVFDYMASTEGTNTYSDFVVDRTGAVTDNVALDPNNANRVRGIGRANIAFANVGTSGRVPVDPLWMDSLELSRGPNANIFGLGEASGTVNQVAATANLSREFTKLEARVDSYGGWRSSFDVNRTLVDNRLALRASYAYQHTGFIREPSGEDARRLSVQLKVQPTKKTTLAVSWYRYTNASQRPNFTTPRDNISNWLAAGKPAWDPVTRLITVNGVTYGQGMVAGSTTPITTMPSYFNNSPTEGRSLFRIGGGADTPYWAIPVVTNASTPAAGGVNNNIRFVSTSAVNSYGAAQPLFASYAAVSDKSIYDWEEYNLLAANKAWDEVDTYLAQLDQIIINTPRQTLAAQLTYLREDAQRVEDAPLGPASVNGVIGELYADPNIRNLDGSANPYFGRPYLRSKEPFLRDKPLLWETVQAQAAYRFDFTQNEGWSKWLGTHQLLGYYEYKDRRNRQYSWRRTATSRDHAWLASQFNAGIPLGNRTTGGNNYPSSHNHMRVYEFYYVGDTPGGGIEYAPNQFPTGATVPFVWGNTGNFRYDPVTIGYTPAPDGSSSGTQNLVKTQGGVVQSTFLDGKLVTTFGLRQDKVFDRNKVRATLTPDLLDFDYFLSGQWEDSSTWRPAEGKTKTASVVVQPFRDLRFFRDQAESGSGIGRFFAEVVTGFRPFYNKSDNFIPQGPAFDLFLNPLPNQTGSSKDYGFWLTLLDGKLSVRYNHFKTDQVNFRNGDISTIAQRVLRADGLLNSNNHDRWNLQDRATDWVTTLNPGFTPAQVRAEVADIMGISSEVQDALELSGDNGTTRAIQDVVSEGDELEINFNPNRYWTISASVTKTESINQNAGSVIEDWITERMPVWESVEDPRFTSADDPTGTIPTGSTGHLLWRYIRGSAFTAYGYDGNNSAATNFVTFVEGPLAVFRQLEGRPRPQLSKYNAKFSTKYQLAGLTDHSVLKNVSVGGSLRWTDEKAIGFLGVQSLPNKITALDTNKPVFSSDETYIDLFVSYNTKLFGDKVRARFQLNAKNVGESGGRLLVTQVFPDGSPLAYRIIDPRQFLLSVSFDL